MPAVAATLCALSRLKLLVAIIMMEFMLSNRGQTRGPYLACTPHELEPGLPSGLPSALS